MARLIGLVSTLAVGVVFGPVPSEAQNPTPVWTQIEAAGTAEDYDGADVVVVFDSLFVDVEEMHGGGFPVPPVYPAGQTGYRHRTVPQIATGQWGPSGDRFAGAEHVAEGDISRTGLIQRL